MGSFISFCILSTSTLYSGGAIHQRHVRMVSLFGAIKQCSYCTPPKALYSGVSTVLSTKKGQKKAKKGAAAAPLGKKKICMKKAGRFARRMFCSSCYAVELMFSGSNFCSFKNCCTLSMLSMNRRSSIHR